MTFFNLFIKGFIIGIAKVIPGVSGAVLAISLGIYDVAINKINTFFKNYKESIKFLLPVGLGVVFAIISSSNIIIYLMDNYYLSTILLFIGLIVGGMRPTIKNINSFNIKNVFFLVSSFMFVILLYIFNLKGITTSDSFITYIVIGIIDAATMVIPGISGTAILMLLGLYDKLINLFSNFINISSFFTNFKLIIPYVIGLLISFIICIKLIDYLFKKCKEQTFCVIIGFSLSSVTVLLIDTLKSNYSFIEIFISIILFIFSYYVSKSLNK